MLPKDDGFYPKRFSSAYFLLSKILLHQLDSGVSILFLGSPSSLSSMKRIEMGPLLTSPESTSRYGTLKYPAPLNWGIIRAISKFQIFL